MRLTVAHNAQPQEVVPNVVAALAALDLVVKLRAHLDAALLARLAQ